MALKTINGSCPYSVGMQICTDDKNFNPNTIYTGTTWELIKGRVMVGVDEDDTDFSTSKKTGGEKNHTLSVDEMPKHRHGIGGDTPDLTSAAYHYSNIIGGGGVAIVNPSANYARIQGAYMSEKGSSQPHNNMPPFRTTYIWVRTK